MKEKKVAVLFGGRSSEHEISLRSTLFILKNIPEKYSIIPVGINREGSFFSIEGSFKASSFLHVTTADLELIVKGKVPTCFKGKKNIKSVFLPLIKEQVKKDFKGKNEFPLRILNLEADCVFPVLHGYNGEDGRMQGLFELAEVAYVGCDIRASVVGIDKDIQKRLARDAGVHIAKYELIGKNEFENHENRTFENIEKSLGYPCFVKPNALGSAVGTGRALTREELKNLLQAAFVFDQKALVEEALVGTEVECAFLGTYNEPRITVAGEIAPKDFYSYEEKYSSTSQAGLFIPARLDQKRMNELKNEAKKIARATGIAGLCRIDFWNCPSKEHFIFNEINTLPGLTSISMFPKLWEHEGVEGKVWINELIEAAFERQRLSSETQYGIKAKL